MELLGGHPRGDGVALRRRVGYLAGDFVVDGRQTGVQLLTYLANLRGGVPRARIDALVERLDLVAEGLEWTRNLSPWHWYLGGDPLVNGLQPGNCLLLLGATVVLVAAGSWRFTARDIAV